MTQPNVTLSSGHRTPRSRSGRGVLPPRLQGDPFFASLWLLGSWQSWAVVAHSPGTPLSAFPGRWPLPVFSSYGDAGQIGLRPSSPNSSVTSPSMLFYSKVTLCCNGEGDTVSPGEGGSPGQANAHGHGEASRGVLQPGSSRPPFRGQPPTMRLPVGVPAPSRGPHPAEQPPEALGARGERAIRSLLLGTRTGGRQGSLTGICICEVYTLTSN